MRQNRPIKYASSLIAGVIIGLGIGLFVGNRQIIKFDATMDISTLISAASLFMALTVIPFVVERKITNTSNINSCATKDLETLSEKISDIINIYNTLDQSSVIDEQTYKTILSSFKDISSFSYALADAFKRFSTSRDFKERIIADAFMPAYEACTEHLKRGKGMSEQQLELSLNRLQALRNTVNQYRYSLFKD